MAGQAAGQGSVQVGSGFIRVVAKTLPEDYNRFKQQWQQGLEQALSNLHLSTPIISNQAATHQGQQAGQHVAQGAQGAIQQQAPQITAPIAAQGSPIGAALGKGIVAGVAAFKAGELIAKGLGTAVESNNIGSKLQASMGLSGQDAAKFQDSVKNLFAGGFTPTMEEASVAIEAVVSSIDGMKTSSGAAVEDVTKKVLTLSNAFEIDAGQSAQILGQMVRTGLVSDVSTGADLLTTTLQKVPVAVRANVLDALDEYTPYLRTLGINGQEAMNMIVKAAEKGGLGLDKTFDALKEFTLRSTDMSATSVDAYQTIGLNAQEMADKIIKGGQGSHDAMVQIAKGLLKIQDPATQSNKAIELFGTQLEDLNVGEVRNFLNNIVGTNDALGNTKGAADKAGEALNSGLGFEMQKLQNSFQIALGDIAIPLLTSILPIVQEVAKWVGENKDLIVQWGGPLLAIGFIVASIVAAVNAFTAVSAVLGPIIAALTAAQWTWNAAMFASPLFIWTVVIGAVILAIILLATHWEEVTKFIGDSINWIGERLQELADWFANLFNGIGDFFTGGGNWVGTLGVQAVGMPMMGNGGLVKAGDTRPRILGEAGQNEVVLNENLYNKNSEAQTNLMNTIINNGVNGGPAVVQNNHFPNVNPREVESIIVGQINQQAGRK